jgi:hypothetical protein
VDGRSQKKGSNSRHLSGSIDAASPTYAAELQQIICASNWMRTGIPMYAELADHLLRLLGQCQDNVGSSKQKLRVYSLSKLSDAAMEMQFVQLRDSIVKRVTLPDSAASSLFTYRRVTRVLRGGAVADASQRSGNAYS